jgi:hypothetical protein
MDDSVKEMKGSKQKEAPATKEKKDKDSFKEKKSNYQSKPGADNKRLKNEQAHGLDHPAFNYETYKRPRRDS